MADNKISVTILVKNGDRTIKKTLDSVRGFDEVLVFDTGSTDQTLSICQQFPFVKVINIPFEGFGKTHNRASALARNPWILSIDSDEMISEELLEEIHSLRLEPSSIYKIRRKNFLNQKHITTCAGWDPDWVSRLYHKGTTAFTEDDVHEKIKEDGMKISYLRNTMQHTPYLQISDFLQKMQSYSSLFATQNFTKKQSSLSKALGHSVLAFMKSYLFKRGILQGKEGFIISLYNSHVTFYKYLKLAELTKYK
ncbi:MAG: glycosyltransferase family 2 protein [Chlamydiae bacterium]|nr:glycosyltransferase family 2 protein [Chlamydiota bacterium]